MMAATDMQASDAGWKWQCERRDASKKCENEMRAKDEGMRQEFEIYEMGDGSVR